MPDPNSEATREVVKPSRRRSQFTTPVDDEEMEFIQAIEAYKKAKGRNFPTWSEALQVLKSLGYSRDNAT